MWKKEVLHRGNRESLWKPTKSPIFREKAAFFDGLQTLKVWTSYPQPCGKPTSRDFLHRHVWISPPRTPQTSARKLSTATDLSRQKPPKTLWKQKKRRFHKTSTRNTPLIHTKSDFHKPKKTCRTYKIPFSTVSTGYTAITTGLSLCYVVLSLFMARARVTDRHHDPSRTDPTDGVSPTDPRPASLKAATNKHRKGVNL